MQKDGSRFNMDGHSVKKKKSVKNLNGWLKHLSKDGLLERTCRCLISLALVLMERF